MDFHGLIEIEASLSNSLPQRFRESRIQGDDACFGFGG
jgi:hypothetical protein